MVGKGLHFDGTKPFTLYLAAVFQVYQQGLST